jgi:hypothetical protein
VFFGSQGPSVYKKRANGIIDSALPEIDEFFDQLEGDLIPAARTIAQSPMFQSFLFFYSLWVYLLAGYAS